MKAHISYSKPLQRQINKDAKIYAQSAVEKEREDLVRRTMKLLLIVLHRKYKFGKQRCLEVLSDTMDLLDESKDDIIFWEHIDRLLLDRYNLPFDRDYTR